MFRLILNYTEWMTILCSTQCHRLYDTIHESILNGFLLLHTHTHLTCWLIPILLTKETVTSMSAICNCSVNFWMTHTLNSFLHVRSFEQPVPFWTVNTAECADWGKTEIAARLDIYVWKCLGQLYRKIDIYMCHRHKMQQYSRICVCEWWVSFKQKPETLRYKWIF